METNPIAAAISARCAETLSRPVDMKSIFIELGIRHVYVIAMTGRCGSTWLASELSSIPNCGRPSEYFSEEMIPHVEPGIEFVSITDLLRSIVESGRTGDTFGFKIDGTRLKFLSEVIDLGASFGPDVAQWIDMRRLNIVKQAFSFARAKRTGVWHVYAGAKEIDRGLSNQVSAKELSDDSIWKEIKLLVSSEAALSQIYKEINVSPLPIKYEEMVDSKSHILIQSLAHLFPDRELPNILGTEGSKTLKLASAEVDPIEMAFIRDNVASINRLRRDRFC